MTYYAHTAEDADGRPLPPESGKWQLLADHLRNVADLAEKFAALMGSEARLRDPHIHGINDCVLKSAQPFGLSGYPQISLLETHVSIHTPLRSDRQLSGIALKL